MLLATSHTAPLQIVAAALGPSLSVRRPWRSGQSPRLWRLQAIVEEQAAVLWVQTSDKVDMPLAGACHSLREKRRAAPLHHKLIRR